MDVGMEFLREAVSERVVQAAATDRRIPGGGTRPAAMKTAWPDMEPPTPIDLEEYDEETREEIRRENAAILTGKLRAEPRDVTRMIEVLEWIARMVETPDRRHALFAWARAQAGGESFRRWAKRKGHHLRTAQRRSSRAIDEICAVFAKGDKSLPESLANAMSSKAAVSGTNLTTLRTVDDDAPTPRETSWMAPDARPLAPHDAASLAASVESVEQAQERIRAAKERAQKRRAKLGLEPIEE